jgi:hypothetical protein
VSVEPEPQKPTTLADHPFPYYLLQIRRDGGDRWNANRIIARLQRVISPLLAQPAKPEPEPVPGSAFLGGAPEAPELDPVLDASGGIAGGGSDYQATGFGAAPGAFGADHRTTRPAPGGGAVPGAPACRLIACARRSYTDYLRSPGLPQLAGAALPGVAGILLMTLGGGVIGYRQANAGRLIRGTSAARYLP